jgi:hypothetical protein
MTPILATVRKILALFVDDSLFAAMIVVWLGIIGIAVRFAAPQPAAALFFFGGLGAILFVSTLSRASRS